MSVLCKMLDVVATFIEIYIIYEIYGELFEPQDRIQNNVLKIVFTVVGIALIRCCNHIALLLYFTVMISVLYTSITGLYLYKRDFVSLFSISSFYMLCLCCFDFLIIAIFSSLWGGTQMVNELISVEGVHRAIFITCVKSTWIVTFLVFKKYIHTLVVKINHAYGIIILSGIGFVGVVFLVSITCQTFDTSLTGVWIAFMTILSFILYVAYTLNVLREEKMKTNFEEMRNNLLEENYKNVYDIYVSNAKLYHDMNNHFNVLYRLLENEDLSAARAYLERIGNPVMTLSKIVWTGDDVVDVIINSKLVKMKEKCIASSINVEFPQNTNISSHDICTILANLLDNAIEATEQLEDEKEISLTIRRINQFVMIKMVNTCKDIKEEFDLYPRTSKDNTTMHGWGLSNVLDVVKKYNGTMDCVNKDGKFIVSIMLFFEYSMET